MTNKDETVFFEKIYPYFEDICKLKHASNEETELVEYLVKFAETHGLRYERDSSGNVAIYRDGSPGLENAEPLLFQGHSDMVCAPDKNIFPIIPQISDGWIHTGGKSTLGADNGIAIAMALELLIMQFEKNPPIECLFTVAEEIGLVGASNIETGKFSLKSSRIINIDSEDIKLITVGCAGAKNLDITFPVTFTGAGRKNGFKIEVKGPGGHSGIVIHEKIPNAIRVAAQIIRKLIDESDVELLNINGGFARNAIPADAEAVVAVDTVSEDDIKKCADGVLKEYKDFQECEVIVSKVPVENEALAKDKAGDIIDLLLSIPHGVVKMNPDTGGVLSSNNLAVLELENDFYRIRMSSRSCDPAEVDEILDAIAKKAEKYEGVKAVKDEGYPGWRPDMNSELLRKTEKAFEKVCGYKPDYLDIHAGLECGILMDKFPVIKEAVSIGPNLHLVHSVNEKLEIATTIDIWNVIQEMIKDYSE